jgi:hypothetical protein
VFPSTALCVVVAEFVPKILVEAKRKMWRQTSRASRLNPLAKLVSDWIFASFVACQFHPCPLAQEHPLRCVNHNSLQRYVIVKKKLSIWIVGSPSSSLKRRVPNVLGRPRMNIISVGPATATYRYVHYKVRCNDASSSLLRSTHWFPPLGIPKTLGSIFKAPFSMRTKLLPLV